MILHAVGYGWIRLDTPIFAQYFWSVKLDTVGYGWIRFAHASWIRLDTVGYGRLLPFILSYVALSFALGPFVCLGLRSALYVFVFRNLSCLVVWGSLETLFLSARLALSFVLDHFDCLGRVRLSWAL